MLLKIKLEARLVASFFVFAATTTGVGLLALYHLDRSAGARSTGLDWLLASGLLGDARDQIIARQQNTGHSTDNIRPRLT